MADYSGEQLRGHTLRIEGEPGDTDGWHLNIYDETDRQRIDNITLIKLTLTPGNVIVAQQVTLRHIDQVTKRPVEEVIDVLPAQLEVSFSALVSRQSQPPRFVECDLDGEALAEELRRSATALTIRSNHGYFEIGAGEVVAGGVLDLPGPNSDPGFNTMPDPTPEQVENDPLFQAIWQVIKSWDVNAPEYYQGYCGATGSHVALILNALQAATHPISSPMWPGALSHAGETIPRSIEKSLANELRMSMGMSYLVHGEWMPPKDNEKWIGYRGPDILYREEGAPNVEQLEHELDLQRLRDFCPGLNTWIAQDAIQPDQIKSVGITAETRQRPPKDNESPLWKHHESTGFYTVSLVLADYSLKQQTFHRADLFEKKG